MPGMQTSDRGISSEEKTLRRKNPSPRHQFGSCEEILNLTGILILEVGSPGARELRQQRHAPKWGTHVADSGRWRVGGGEVPGTCCWRTNRQPWATPTGLATNRRKATSPFLLPSIPSAAANWQAQQKGSQQRSLGIIASRVPVPA